MRGFAKTVVARLREKGYVAYFAGGCVRDELLGLAPKDFDVATNATPKVVQALFPRTIPVGAQFGVIIVLGPAKCEVEVATFRSDGAYTDGRRPSQVRYGNEFDDAARRDFTINGLFLDPDIEKVIDHVQGRADLQKKILRAIGEPEERFAEDKLRILRAVRFASHLGFEIELRTKTAILKHGKDLTQVSAERIGQELLKMVTGNDPGRAIRLLREFQLLPVILPLVSDAVEKQDQGSEVFDRIVNLVNHSGGDPDLGLAALFHPIDPDPDIASEQAQKSCRSLRYSNDRIAAVGGIVSTQKKISDWKSLSLSVQRRILAEPLIDSYLAFLKMKIAAAKTDPAIACVIEESLLALGENRRLPPPLVRGEDVIALGIRPGPRIKEVLRAVQDLQLERKIQSREDALLEVQKMIKKGVK